MAVAVIVAAGRGERLGIGRPKALVTLAGKPMLQWSVEALRAVAGVERIVIALPAGQLAAAPAGTVAVAGGEVRSESVREGLAACGESEAVIVHDAARPLASPDLFDLALAELERSSADAVVAATPVSDTVKEVGDDGRTVTKTLDRTRLWSIQTPQAFRRAALAKALRDAPAELLAAATDDAWLVEREGGNVRVVHSDPQNIKVTTIADLHLAERLLLERSR